jgi:regulator of replication initiation timing
MNITKNDMIFLLNKKMEQIISENENTNVEQKILNTQLSYSEIYNNRFNSNEPLNYIESIIKNKNNGIEELEKQITSKKIEINDLEDFKMQIKEFVKENSEINLN